MIFFPLTFSYALQIPGVQSHGKDLAGMHTAFRLGVHSPDFSFIADMQIRPGVSFPSSSELMGQFVCHIAMADVYGLRERSMWYVICLIK